MNIKFKYDEKTKVLEGRLKLENGREIGAAIKINLSNKELKTMGITLEQMKEDGEVMIETAIKDKMLEELNK